MDKKPIIYYISSHGFGHGVRSCDIIRWLMTRRPDVPLIITTMLPEVFFRVRLPESDAYSVRKAGFDTGIVQNDSVSGDVQASFNHASLMYRRKPKLLADETGFLLRSKAALIVTDIPGMPIEAAFQAGIPAVAIGNFSWDWIYSPFAEENPDWRPIIAELQSEYCKAHLLLRLPFHGPMDAFSMAMDIPLTACSGTAQRDRVAEWYGVDPAKKWILFGFTALCWQEQALNRVAQYSDYEFFAMPPVKWQADNIHIVKREQLSFSDLTATVDAVLSKPGFGIVSECIVNGKPLIYTDRSHFVEYPFLVKGIEKYLRNIHIPSEKLYAGELAEALDAVWERPAPCETMANGGERIAVDEILKYY